MKSVIISIKSEHVADILNHKKTLEIRKSIPNLAIPFKVYIYCTKSKPYLYKDANSNDYFVDSQEWRGGDYESRFLSGKIVGEFICDYTTEFESEFWDDTTYESIAEVWYDGYGERNVDIFIDNDDNDYKENELCKSACVSWDGIREYVGTGIKTFYGWHIADLTIYHKPKHLDEFRTKNKKDIGWGIDTVPVSYPPQSYMFVEEL